MINISGITIRKARKSDIGQIYKLGLATKELWVSPKTRFYTKRELSSWIKNPKDNLLLVATYKNKIVGFSFTKAVSIEWAMGDTMAIQPEYRSTGIGSLLNKKRIAILKKKKLNFLSGLVGVDHKQARSFWKKMGYTEGKKLYWIEKNI